LHIPLIHVTALIVNFFRTGAIIRIGYAYAPFTSIPEESRWSLAMLYLVFVIDAIILYAACRRYVNYKFSHPEKKMAAVCLGLYSSSFFYLHQAIFHKPHKISKLMPINSIL